MSVFSVTVIAGTIPVLSVVSVTVIAGTILVLSVVSATVIAGTVSVLSVVSVIVITGTVSVIIRNLRLFYNSIDNFLLLYCQSHIVTYHNFIGSIFIYIDIIGLLPCLATVKRISLFGQTTSVSVICCNSNTNHLLFKIFLFNRLNFRRIIINIQDIHTASLCIVQGIICRNLIFSCRQGDGIKMHFPLFFLIWSERKDIFSALSFYFNLSNSGTIITYINMNLFLFCPCNFIDYNRFSNVQYFCF